MHFEKRYICQVWWEKEKLPVVGSMGETIYNLGAEKSCQPEYKKWGYCKGKDQL